MISPEDINTGVLYMHHIKVFDDLIFPVAPLRIVSAAGRPPNGSAVNFDYHGNPLKDCYVIYPEGLATWHERTTPRDSWQWSILESQFAGRVISLLPAMRRFVCAAGHEVRHRVQFYAKPKLYTVDDLDRYPLFRPLKGDLHSVLRDPVYQRDGLLDGPLEVDARICTFIIAAMLVVGTVNNRGLRWATTRGSDDFPEIEREYGLAL